jgi:hypothetical protein
MHPNKRNSEFVKQNPFSRERGGEGRGEERKRERERGGEDG